jgi:tRNA pseudouridine38-40 synthase
MRYFIELAYNGANYKGWQRQPGAPSVQQAIVEALSKLTGEAVKVTGAGRTDTGVHAAYYIAHLDVSEEIVNEADFLYHANSILPPDIALKSVRRVADDAHARYDAREREYTYRVVQGKDPFSAGTAWQYTVPLDVEAMNRAAGHLLKVSDFTTFAKLGGGNKTNICRVTLARWSEHRQGGTIDGAGKGDDASRGDDVGRGDGAGKGDDVGKGELVFTIRADRFLRNMVRAIVGTLVDVGRGKMTPEDFAARVDAKDLSLSSGGAPAHGLFLTDIKY